MSHKTIVEIKTLDFYLVEPLDLLSNKSILKVLL